MNGEPGGEAIRGQGTREALVAAALEVFGRDGFHAASTRAIADAAGVNQALIGYHFNGKEGLYLAVFEHIAQRLGERMGPVIASVEAELAQSDTVSRNAKARIARYLPLLERLLDACTAVLVGDEAARWARLVVREQQSPTPAFDLLYTRGIGRLIDVVARLVGRILDTAPDRIATNLLVFTIFGQVLAFRVAHAALMRRTGWQRIGAPELRQIETRIRRNVAAILKEELTR